MSAADVVLLVHALWIAAVVVPVPFLLVAPWLERRCACKRVLRSNGLRGVHVAMIAIVAIEAGLGVACPLTTLENALRDSSHQIDAPGGFIAFWLHRLLFYDFAPWVFTLAYAAFFLLVLALYWLVPPTWLARRR